MARVFISYRHDDPDRAVADALRERLNEAGHDVFFDAEDIRVGDLWDGKIGKKLEDAEYFVPLISASYFSREYILHRELKVAWRLFGEKKLRQILPVNIAYDGDPPPDVREAVSQVQHLKWRGEGDTDRLCREIVSSLPAPEDLVKGMHPFVYADQKLFAQLGREAEVADFVSLLGESRSPYVLLHGVSGAGKTSFLRAGVLPRLGDPPPAVAELTADAAESFGALTTAGTPLVILDQFEQSLIRFAQDAGGRLAFEEAVEAWVAGRAGRRIVFCLRDEFRTPFDAMLPRVSRHTAQASFALLPLRPDTAARVLGRLLDNVRAEHDADFLGRLCEDYLAEGVPRRVLPALLQMVAQYWRGRDLRLDKPAWERLTAPDSSLFEEHVRGAVLERLPRRLSLEAAQSLAALAEGEFKSRRKSAEEIAEDYQLSPEAVRRTMEAASLPSARVVAVETEAEDARPHYRLVHDLFVPAVHALRRDASLARDRRRRNQLIGLFAVLFAVSAAAGAVAFWQRSVARRQGEMAVARQLVMQANDLRTSGGADFTRSLLFAAESHRLFPTAESDAAVRAALARAPLHLARLRHPTDITAAPRFSRSGGMLVTGGSRGMVRVWDFGARRPMADFDAGLPVSAVAFGDEDDVVAAGAGDWGSESSRRAGSRGVAVAWVVRGGRELARADFDSPVTEVAFVGGTRQLVAVAAEAAKVFGGAGSPPATIPLGEDVITTALSADGGLLAVGRGRRVEVYELPGARLAFTLEPNTASPSWPHVRLLAFSADGKRLAAVGGGYSLRVWDVASRRPLVQDTEPMRWPSFLALSDDGALVARTDYTGATEVLSVNEGGTRVTPVEADENSFTVYYDKGIFTAFRPHSYDLFTPAGDGASARLHRLGGALGPKAGSRAAELLRLTPGRVGADPLLALSHDGRYAVMTDGGDAHIWELKSGRVMAEAPGDYPAAFSPSGRYFVSQTREHIEIFDLKAGAAASLPPAPMPDEEGTRTLAFGGGELLAVLGRDRDAIEIYDMAAGAKAGRVSCGGAARSVAFARDGRDVLFSLEDNSLWRAGADGGTAVEVLKGGDAPIGFSSGGGYLYHIQHLPDPDFGGREKIVLEVFETSGGEPFLRAPLYDARVEFSDDDEYLAAFTGDKVITVWETDSGQVLRRLNVEESHDADFALSGDGLLAIAGREGVAVWNVRTGSPVASLRHGGAAAKSVTFGRPGTDRLLATSADGKARVWDLGHAAVVAVVEGIEPARKGAFSRDGKYFMTVGLYNAGTDVDARAQVMLLRPEDLREEVCRRVAFNLKPEEWALYTSYQPAEKTCPELP
jgi:WD40 repeat protein